MLMSIVLTIIVVICFYLLMPVVNGAPFGNAVVKWGIYAIMAIIAVAIIFNIWNIPLPI